MDWSRAKSILIAMLLALNVFLLAYIGFYRFPQTGSKEAVKNAVQVLDKRGVKLECALPEYRSDTPRLVYTSGGLDSAAVVKRLLGDSAGPGMDTDLGKAFVSGGRKLVITGSNTYVFTDDNPGGTVDTGNMGAVEKYAREFLTRQGVEISSFITDRVAENKDGGVTLHFTEKYGKLLVFDNYMDVTVTGRGITYFKYSCRTIKGFSGKKMQLLPAYIILLDTLDFSGGTAITHIDIGFKGYNTGEDMKEYAESPAWRIVTGDGRERFFKAAASSGGEEIIDAGIPDMHP